MKTATRKVIRADVYDPTGSEVLIKDAEIQQQRLADGQIHSIGILVSDALAYRQSEHAMLIKSDIVNRGVVVRGETERMIWYAPDEIKPRSKRWAKLIGPWKIKTHNLMTPLRHQVRESYL